MTRKIFNECNKKNIHIFEIIGTKNLLTKVSKF